MIVSIPLAKEKYLEKINEKTINFVMSDGAEIGSAGEQPIRHNLADWNENEDG